jgi:hypothetical protein
MLAPHELSRQALVERALLPAGALNGVLAVFWPRTGPNEPQ